MKSPIFLALLGLSSWCFASEAIRAEWTFDGRPVTLPHTWNAADGADGGTPTNWPGHNSVSSQSYDRGKHVYATILKRPAENRRLFLRVPAACAKAEVRLDGRRIMEHVGAFASFGCELTPFRDGAVLEIEVDNAYDPHMPPNEGDFTMFGGLYRGVELIEKPRVAIDPVRHVRVDADSATGHVIVRVPVTGDDDAVREFDFPSPELWSPENPRLYTVRVSVGEDSEDVTFGFRTVEMRKDGFYLNGRKRVLRGVCRHQDAGPNGWAATAADEERDISLIREMGADAIRTSHYPCSRNFYDLCDRKGILVWTEVPLVDEVPADDPLFAERALQMAREMIEEHRNHPSIVMWGAFNEVYQFRKPDGTSERTVRDVVKLMHELDATRPVVGASNGDKRGLDAIPDGLGRNLYPGWYWKSAERMGEDIAEACAFEGREAICVSEYGAGGGVFTHGDPLDRPKSPGGAWHSEEYQAYFHAATYSGIKDNPCVWGSFAWVMFDAASDARKEGENHGINDKGLVTRDRQTKKDAFYLYKANWSSDPVLHLVGKRMSSTTNSAMNVLGFSNVGGVTLTVNGVVVGDQVPDKVCAVLFRGVRLSPGENRIVLSAGQYKDSSVRLFTGAGYDGRTVRVTDGSGYGSWPMIQASVKEGGEK